MSELTIAEAREVELFDQLFAEAQDYFRRILSELRAYDIEPDPNIELRRSNGMQSYYNLSDGHIYLAIPPDLSTSNGRVFKLFMKSLLSIDDDEKLVDFIRLFTPRLLAHELGHHLRHRYQQFRRDNLWQEEQVANQLAMAVMKRRLTPEQKQKARELLSHAISVLSTKMEAKDIAVDSYRNIVQALNVTQQLGDDALDSIELMRSVFAIDAEALLRASGQLPEQVMQRLEQREEIIDQINEQYTSDAVRYLYYHLGWLYCDLLSKQSEYIDEFAVMHLGLKPKLLPAVDVPVTPERMEIRALYRAFLDLKDQSPLGRRYYYKRYRSYLLNRLEKSQLTLPNQTTGADLSILLETWNEGEDDPLEYVALVAPAELKRVFPDYLAAHPDLPAMLPEELPTETDQRLWKHLQLGEPDEEAANTLRRLEILENAVVLRPLPAEVQLWAAHRMYRLKLDTGEPVIWSGEKTSDIFILTEGILEILVGDHQASKHVGIISPGTMFGEMSFVTREARSASIRALKPSECFVLKASDMRPMAVSHPALLIQIARTLAEKLDQSNKKMAVQQQSGETIRLRPPSI